MTPSEQAELLKRELREAGVAFARNEHGQRPHASIRYCENQGPELTFTATIRNGAFQLWTSANLKRRAAGGAETELRALNDNWGIGRASYDVQQSNCRLFAAYPVFSRRPEKQLLTPILAGLYWVAVALSSDRDSPWKDARDAVHVFRSTFPATDTEGPVDTLAAALHRIGHPFGVVAPRQLRQSFHEPDGNSFSVSIAPVGDSFIRITTISRSIGGLDRDNIDRLNDLAPIGCFIDSYAPNIQHIWDFPPEFIAINDRLASWLIEVGAQMSAAARKI